MNVKTITESLKNHGWMIHVLIFIKNS